jgi:hypothetical protein
VTINKHFLQDCHNLINAKYVAVFFLFQASCNHGFAARGLMNVVFRTPDHNICLESLCHFNCSRNGCKKQRFFITVRAHNRPSRKVTNSLIFSRIRNPSAGFSTSPVFVSDPIPPLPLPGELPHTVLSIYSALDRLQTPASMAGTCTDFRMCDLRIIATCSCYISSYSRALF